MLDLLGELAFSALEIRHKHKEQLCIQELICMRNFTLTSLLSGLAYVAMLSNPALAQSSSDDTRKGVEASLQESVQFWNAGDLAGFMKGYWDSPDMTFTSGGKLIRGHDALEKRYSSTYGSNTKAMGQLNFDHIEISSLGDEHALALGQWHLTLTGKPKPGKSNQLGGVFSLVLKKTQQGWKIVHDHTSQGQP